MLLTRVVVRAWAIESRQECCLLLCTSFACSDWVKLPRFSFSVVLMKKMMQGCKLARRPIEEEELVRMRQKLEVVVA